MKPVCIKSAPLYLSLGSLCLSIFDAGSKFETVSVGLD